MTSMDAFSELIETGRRLLVECVKIQDTTGLADTFPLAERQALADDLAREYHSWYAKAQATLPEADKAEFTKPYEGTFFAPGIKKFFAEPLATNPFHNPATASIVGPWLHPYSTALKQQMHSQITIITRRRENRPAILRLPDGDVRLPRNLSGHQTSMENWLSKWPFEKNVFLMMKYRQSNRHIADIIRLTVESTGLKLWLASEVRITDELATNVVACLLCCKYGIALFDEPEDAQHINPNVAYELGMLHVLDRACLLLKSQNINIQSDLLARLYSPYDPTQTGDIISQTKKWLVDVGAAK